MSAHRTSISINEGLYAAAEVLMKDKHFDSFSAYVEDLIRRDNERMKAEKLQTQFIHEPGMNEEPTSYRSGTKVKKVS